MTTGLPNPPEVTRTPHGDVTWRFHYLSDEQVLRTRRVGTILKIIYVSGMALFCFVPGDIDINEGMLMFMLSLLMLPFASMVRIVTTDALRFVGHVASFSPAHGTLTLEDPRLGRRERRTLQMEEVSGIELVRRAGTQYTPSYYYHLVRMNNGSGIKLANMGPDGDSIALEMNRLVLDAHEAARKRNRKQARVAARTALARPPKARR